MTQDEIEKEIALIRERNKRVELDKSWEVSIVRRLFISLISYLVAGIWLVIIGDSYPWLKAFVPMAGYILSTLSLPVVKRWWVSKNGD